MKHPIGITYIVPDGQEAVGVYDDPSGIEVFETDSPYTLRDGVSLQVPLPVKIVDPTRYPNSTRTMQTPLAMALGAATIDGVTALPTTVKL